MLRSLDAENAACAYAPCANSTQPTNAESLTAEQQTLRQEYTNLALACLHESIAAGYSDFEQLQQDPDWTMLRHLREFEELIYTPTPPPLTQ